MVFGAGHLKSYFEGPARLARRPLPLGRLVPPGLGVFFLLRFCVLFPSVELAGFSGRAVVNATLAQAIYWRAVCELSKPLRKVCPENLLLEIGLRPIYSATTQTTI